MVGREVATLVAKDSEDREVREVRLWKGKRDSGEERMASPESVIQQLAFGIDRAAQERAAILRKELRELEVRKEQLLAAIDHVDSAHERLKSFTAKVGKDYQCPRCWVGMDRHTTLKPAPGDHHGDRFRCPVCDLPVLVPYKR